MAHLAHPFFKLKVLVLLNNSCAKPFGTLGTNGDFIDFFDFYRGTVPYLARETFFSFEKTLFALKSPLYRIYD